MKRRHQIKASLVLESLEAIEAKSWSPFITDAQIGEIREGSPGIEASVCLSISVL